jgi:hypothetical protein
LYDATTLICPSGGVPLVLTLNKVEVAQACEFFHDRTIKSKMEALKQVKYERSH